MPWMLALDPTSETAAELVSLGFTPVTMYMKQVAPNYSEGHIKLSDQELSRMNPSPPQYASLSFLEHGELGPVFAVAFAEDAEQGRKLIAMGFAQRELFKKTGPAGSTTEAIPKGERQFRAMCHVPSRFASVCYWGRAPS